MTFGLDYTVTVVVFGAGVVGMLSAAMGSFLYVRRDSLFADLVSHSSLPGIALSTILISGMNFILLVLGAMISALGVTAAADFLRTRLKVDSGTLYAVAITCSFGLGIVLMSYAQRLGIAIGGIGRFLLGQVAAITFEQVAVIVVLSVTVLVVITVFSRQLQLISFDPVYAQIMGVPIKAISLLFTVLLTVAIATGISIVGAILMVALMVSPALMARPWCSRLHTLVTASSAIGFAGAVTGSAISFIDPRLPTGASIVLVLAVWAVLSLSAKWLVTLQRTGVKR